MGYLVDYCKKHWLETVRVSQAQARRLTELQRAELRILEARNNRVYIKQEAK